MQSPKIISEDYPETWGWEREEDTETDSQEDIQDT